MNTIQEAIKSAIIVTTYLQYVDYSKYNIIDTSNLVRGGYVGTDPTIKMSEGDEFVIDNKSVKFKNGNLDILKNFNL